MRQKDDSTVTLSELMKLVTEFVSERDWAKYHNPKDLAIAISLEASELLENFLWLPSNESSQLPASSSRGLSAREELSDIFIYCLLMAMTLEADLYTEVVSKLEKNRRKYPVDRYKGTYRKPTC